jgi:hypothetical protein
MRFATLLVAGLPLAITPLSFGQDPQTLNTSQNVAAQPAPESPPNKRILGIIPNYRTYPTEQDYHPISQREKFKIAAEDTFDRGSFILAAGFAGESQLTNNTPSFGQGVAGYARYFGAAYADIAIGDFMTEAIYPALLHQDPRYFRRGTGSGPSRAWYAVRQLFWTRTDSGGWQVNYSEIGGNATAAAIANAYYRDNRTAAAAASKLAIQLGIDGAGNLLKEFWPDIERKFGRKSKDVKP